MSYTIQNTGGTSKILASTYDKTRAVTSIKDEKLASSIAMTLNGIQEFSQAGSHLGVTALENYCQPAHARRDALSGYASGLRGEQVDTTKYPTTIGHSLGQRLQDQPSAVQSAVKEELANLFEGTDTVLVIARLVPYGSTQDESLSDCVINAWLTSATNAQLRGLLYLSESPQVESVTKENYSYNEDDIDTGAQYDLFEYYQGELESGVFDTDDLEYYDLTVDLPSLAAWIESNRPDFIKTPRRP